MGGNDIDLGFLANQTHPRLLKSVDAAFPRAKVAVGQMGVRLGALLGGIH